MALLPTDQRSQVMLLLTILAVAGGWGFWKYYYDPASKQIDAAKAEIDSLQIIIERAKQDLAQGTMEDLRRKVDQYRAMVGLMRRLVPEQNEVPALIDDISTKAKVRGVTIGKIDPLPVDPGPPFDTYRYRLELLIVLKPASQAAQRLLTDTVGALLEADLSIRTFVKSSAPKPPAKPGAKAGGGG